LLYVAEGFEDLAVYRRCAAFADQVHAAVRQWSPFDQWTIRIQLVRAADSTGANIAEGTGRFGPADQRRFLFIARGSASELQHWVERAAGRELHLPAGARKEAVEIGRMLSGLVRRIPSH
jgi:four helix bundle protein